VSVAAGEPSAPGPVLVGDGKQEVVVLGSDIRHIKAAPPSLVMTHAPLWTQGWYWLGWGLPLLAVVVSGLWSQRRRVLAQDVAYARTLRARRVAHKRLTAATKLLKHDADAAYAAVARAVTHYLGDKFNLPSAGLTRNAIRAALVGQDVPVPLIERVLVCLDWADSGRFAPVAAGRNVADLVAEAEAVLAALEGAMGA